MKRTIFFKTFSLFIVFSYCVLIALGIFGLFPFHKLWFSLLLFCLGTICLSRFFCFGIESSLFAGTLLLLCGTAGGACFLLKLSAVLTIALYLAALALSELAIFVKFRQIFHLKAFSFEAVCVILLVLFNQGLLPVPAFVALICILGAVVVGMIGSAIKVNTRKV